MSEMRRVACPSCDEENHPYGVIDGLRQYRCRSCGLVYYGPCECEVTHFEPAPAVQAAQLADDDWQMNVPVVLADGASEVRPHPGCS